MKVVEIILIVIGAIIVIQMILGVITGIPQGLKSKKRIDTIVKEAEKQKQSK